MSDQADQLRKLVHEAAQLGSHIRDVPLVVVCGGQRGVGTSTVALHLALTWQRQKRKAVLVDASFHVPSFFAPARAKRHDTLVDVLSGGRTVAEVLRPGPHGLSIIPGAELPPALTDVAGKTWTRVIGQLRSLQASADAIVFDAGAGTSKANAPLWHAANYVLLVTRSQPVGITDTYAVLKAASLRMALPTVGVACNDNGPRQAADPSESHPAAARIASAASRFLNLDVNVLAAIPHAVELVGATAASSRLHKESALRNAFEAIAEDVWQTIQVPSSAPGRERGAA
jgi:flagellar biosynthesis protein FlhG